MAKSRGIAAEEKNPAKTRPATVTAIATAPKSVARTRKVTASKAKPSSGRTGLVRSEASTGRRQRQIEAKRESILSAALSLFSRYGLHGTSIDQVAKQADVSKTNLLYYFPNKDDLYLTVLRDLLNVWLKPLREFRTDQNPEEAIGDFIRQKLTNSRDNPEASRLFCMEILQGAPLLQEELGHELRELVERKSEVIATWVKEGRLAQVHPHHFIFVLWSTTQHYADFSAQVEAITGKTLNDPEFFEETVANVQRIVLHGVMRDALNP